MGRLSDIRDHAANLEWIAREFAELRPCKILHDEYFRVIRHPREWTEEQTEFESRATSTGFISIDTERMWEPNNPTKPKKPKADIAYVLACAIGAKVLIFDLR
jgi:hypothetical protein